MASFCRFLPTPGGQRWVQLYTAVSYLGQGESRRLGDVSKVPSQERQNRVRPRSSEFQVRGFPARLALLNWEIC
jgi:hypothetical protein